MPVEIKIAESAIKELRKRYGFDFTLREFQAICKQYKITRYINRGGGFDTGERETFCDAIAKHFTGFDHWPSYGEGFNDMDEFSTQLHAGYKAFKAGKPNPHNPQATGRVLIHRGLLLRLRAGTESESLREEIDAVLK